jgi:hypothetical protein
MLTRSLVTSRNHVYSEDEAIDTDSTEFDYDKFLKTGDLKYVPAKPGAKLTVFTLRPITEDQFVRLVDMREPMRQAVEAVSVGLVKVADMVVNGQEVQLRTTKQGTEERLHKDSISTLLKFPAVMRELATIIMTLGRLDP